MDELRTRLVPWEAIEVVHARNRPHAERSAWPRLGDRLLYRRHDWDRDPRTGVPVEPELGTVIDVQDPEDRTDPNLWHQIRSPQGRPLVAPGGGPVHRAVPDPWPWVNLRLDDRRKEDGWLIRYGEVIRTREARLRGSAGWLPLDYRQRPERGRLPAQTALVARPTLIASTRVGVGAE